MNSISFIDLKTAMALAYTLFYMLQKKFKYAIRRIFDFGVSVETDTPIYHYRLNLCNYAFVKYSLLVKSCIYYGIKCVESIFEGIIHLSLLVIVLLRPKWV